MKPIPHIFFSRVACRCADACGAEAHLCPVPVQGGHQLADAAHNLLAEVVGGVGLVKAVVHGWALPKVAAGLVGRERCLPGLQKTYCLSRSCIAAERYAYSGVPIWLDILEDYSSADS